MPRDPEARVVRLVAPSPRASDPAGEENGCVTTGGRCGCVCLLLAGCKSVSLGTSTSSESRSPLAGAAGSAAPAGGGRAVAVGAGPQEHYTVQEQPAAGSCHYRYERGEPLADPKCTPGAISPAVTQANLKSTICRRGGYTSEVRPSTYVTGKQKRLNAAS
ncbi:hypothetical protein [Streptomyces sp. NPDC047043]|uniref:hypothetical protein n=1 Tax=Streptomyces sp. NPDC047043 TaxID=3154497 RepID=UPI0034008667